MDVWEQVGRISGVAFQVFAAVAIGIGLGIAFERLVPGAGIAGPLVGGLVGSGVAIYLMVSGMRRFFAEADASEGGKKENTGS